MAVLPKFFFDHLTNHGVQSDGPRQNRENTSLDYDVEKLML